MTKISNINYILLIIVLFIFTACELPKIPFKQETKNDKNKKWVYIYIEMPMKYDTSDYYYYGEVNEKLLADVENNNINGFFTLRNIRFVNDSDKLELYEDKLDLGTILFKKQDIVKIHVLKTDPVQTYGYEDLAENAKKLFRGKK